MIREGFKNKIKKKVGIFPLGFRPPPPLQKVGKNIFFLFDIWCLKSIFVQRNFFGWLVPLVLGVGAPKIRDPSPNLGVSTPNIGDPSPSAPKIRDPSPNLEVGTPNIGDPSPKKNWQSRKRVKTRWEIFHYWSERVGGVPTFEKKFFPFLDDSDHV